MKISSQIIRCKNVFKTSYEPNTSSRKLTAKKIRAIFCAKNKYKKKSKAKLRIYFLVAGNEFISKSYYLSQSFIEPISSANQICESFNMILAAPQDQSEYDNLKKLMKRLNVKNFEAAISGYRSELNDGLWLINGKEVNFDISWLDGEPSNDKNAEFCYGKRKRIKANFKHLNIFSQQSKLWVQSSG